ncbi:hypothetical protein KBD69_03220 [Candidatus Woesebacteria bacterium]|nr:hypothetical protein [Candidatus Woesebacteria bacterium]
MIEADILPYTSFVGPGGITFCSEGVVHGGVVKASAVYFPDYDGSRLRFEDNTYHSKKIFDGSRGEESSFTDLAKEIISFFYHIGESTGQRFIHVPKQEIARVYDHRESLFEILQGKHNAPELLRDKLKATLKFLATQDINPRDVGLYGGLQSFLVSRANSNFKDIDLVFHGIENVTNMKRLASLTQLGKTFSSQSRVRSTPEDMRRRRHELTRIYLPDDAYGTYLDIKILRNPSDPVSYPYDATVAKRMNIRGKIVDDSEAFSTPTNYRILTDEGQYIDVSSVKYDFIAGAGNGDTVEVSGMRCKEHNNLLLIDPDDDYIRVQ